MRSSEVEPTRKWFLTEAGGIYPDMNLTTKAEAHCHVRLPMLLYSDFHFDTNQN